MEQKSLVSVIVTNFNGERYLDKCFQSLKDQTYPNIELILADDCSTDGSIDLMKKNFPEVILALSDKNGGLSINSNNGAKKANGDYLLFYNNDTIALPDFVEQLVIAAEQNPSCAVVCPRQLPYREEDEATLTEDQKDIGVGSDIYGYVCTAKDAGTVFYPDAAIFIKHTVFNELGGFDPLFFLYGEDMDLCHRVHLFGYKLCVAADAKFRHDSFCQQRDAQNNIITGYKRRYFVERQVINKLLKYYGLGTLLWIVPSFLFFYTLEALFFLIYRRDWRMVKDVYWAALAWNIQILKQTLQARACAQKNRKLTDLQMMKLMYPYYRKLVAVFRLGIPVLK